MTWTDVRNGQGRMGYVRYCQYVWCDFLQNVFNWMRNRHLNKLDIMQAKSVEGCFGTFLSYCNLHWPNLTEFNQPEFNLTRQEHSGIINSPGIWGGGLWWQFKIFYHVRMKKISINLWNWLLVCIHSFLILHGTSFLCPQSQFLALSKANTVWNLLVTSMFYLCEVNFSWWSCNSLVSIVTRLWSGWPGFNSWQGKGFSFFATTSRVVLEPPILLSIG